MRNSIFAVTLLLPFALNRAQAVDWPSYEPANETGIFSSEDASGGSSYLGVDTRDVSSDRLGTLQLKEESGVEVTMVDQDAPAGKAGLKEHDVILTVNGEKVESVEQLRRMIHEIPAGRSISLGISRNGQPMAIKAQLAERKKWFSYSSSGPGEFKFAMPAMPAMPAIPAMPAMPDIDVPISVVVVHSSARSGLMVENLTPQLGDFFGTKDGQGVLVRSVEKGSKAEKAGFHAGDVIVKVNGQPIHDSGDFSHALRSQSQKDVNVSVIRDRKEQTITLAIPEHKSQFLDESFETPDVEVDADTMIDLSELDTELAQVRPQMQLAAGELLKVKPELDTIRSEVPCQDGKVKKQNEQVRRAIRDQMRQLKKIRVQMDGQADI